MRSSQFTIKALAAKIAHRSNMPRAASNQLRKNSNEIYNGPGCMHAAPLHLLQKIRFNHTSGLKNTTLPYQT